MNKYNGKATYGMVKPYSENHQVNDIAQEVILQELTSRLKSLGLNVEEMHEICYDGNHVQKHYYEHVGRPYYGKLADCLLANKAIGLVITNNDKDSSVIDTVRSIAGSTLKVDKETGEVTRIHEPGSIRYNLSFILFQMKNGVDRKDIVIPSNVDDCQLVFDANDERVDIIKDGVKISEMFMTQNFIHTSSCIEDANNEIGTFLDQYEINKQQRLNALKKHAQSKSVKVK